MIPKIIHYCWLSNDCFPYSVQKCIDSWERILPDYQLILWDYSRFPRGKSKWVDQAFDKHKYAFAADYIRLYALYNYGGIYLDSDVEVIKSYNDLLDLPYIIGAEQSPFGIEAATMAFPEGSVFVKGILDRYIDKNFVNDNGSINIEPLPRIIRRHIAANYDYHLIHEKEDFIDNPSIINIFSADFFSPKSYITREINPTHNTYSIHHFAGSWVSPSNNEFIEQDPSPTKKTLRKRIRYHLFRPNINIISSLDVSNIFHGKFNVSIHNPLLYGEISFNDIIQITTNKIKLSPDNISFIRKIESQKHVYDFYPIIKIRDTNIEVHYKHDFSREIVLDYWINEYNILKNKRNVYIIPTQKEKSKLRIYLAVIKILMGWKRIKL